MDLETLLRILIGRVTGGAIVGLDGHVWASTPGFYDYQNELVQMRLNSCFNVNADAKIFGLCFRNELYLLTRCTDETVVAQNYGKAFSFAKCKRCIVFGFVDDLRDLSECLAAVKETAKSINEKGIED